MKCNRSTADLGRAHSLDHLSRFFKKIQYMYRQFCDFAMLHAKILNTF